MKVTTSTTLTRGSHQKHLYKRAGTPYGVARRILDHLCEDLREGRIPARLIIDISYDLKQALNNNNH